MHQLGNEAPGLYVCVNICICMYLSLSLSLSLPCIVSAHTPAAPLRLLSCLVLTLTVAIMGASIWTDPHAPEP